MDKSTLTMPGFLVTETLFFVMPNTARIASFLPLYFSCWPSIQSGRVVSHKVCIQSSGRNPNSLTIECIARRQSEALYSAAGWLGKNQVKCSGHVWNEDCSPIVRVADVRHDLCRSFPFLSSGECTPWYYLLVPSFARIAKLIRK